MNSYTEFRDSGIEWIGEIPSSWDVQKVKHCCHVTLGKMLTPNDKGGMSKGPYLRSQNVQDGGLDLKDVNEMWFSNREITSLGLATNDLLVTEGGQVGRTALWNGSIKPCYFQNSLIRIRTFNGDQKFFLYLFQTWFHKGYFDSVVNRVSIPHLTKEKLSEIRVLCPGLEEQKKISRYLDRKTYLIDSLIEKISLKIELLKEQRTSLINQCVTKGLDPDIGMRDSGVGWIGTVPSHWELIKLKYIVSCNTEVLANKTDPNYEFTYIEISDVDYFEGISYKKNRIAFSDSPSRARRVLRKGDVIISTVRTYLRAIGLINRHDDLIGSTGFCVLRSSKKISEGYLSYAVRSEWFISDVVSNSDGVSYPAINPSDLVDLKITLPPQGEQILISNYLDKKTSQIDSLIGKEAKRIELLKEYRQSLISNVVTGKVRVMKEMI